MKNAGDILRGKGTETYTTDPGSTVFQALEQMADKDVGALLVFDGDRMVGLISERDYARKVILKNKFSKDTPVADIMSTEMITVSPATDLETCMQLITEHRVRHLPVVEDGRVVGIVSIGDIVKGIIEHKEFIITQLEKYIKGSPG
jgi:CBS domain-containing protein